MPAVAPRAWRSCSRRWSATCSATRPRWPSTPRPARCARPGPPSSRGRRQPGGDGEALLRRCAPGCEPLARRFFDGLRAGAYDGHLEASTAVRAGVAVPLRPRHRAARGVPARARQGRHAGRRVEDLTAALTQRHRGADPARRRHQAPGQDRHRGHLPLRRDAAAGAAGARGAGRRVRPATASATRPCARWPISTRGRRGARLHPLPDRGRRRRRRQRRRHRRGHRPGRRRPRAASAGPTDDPRAAGHQAPGRHRARGAGGQGPQRRPHGDHRARDQGRRDHRAHPAARALRRPPAAAVAAGGAAGLPEPLRRPASDAVTETEPTFRDDLLAEVARGRPADRAGQRPGRPLAQRDRRCRRDRHRPGRPRPVPRGPRPPAGDARAALHRRRAGVRRAPAATRPSATRCGSRPRRR